MSDDKDRSKHLLSKDAIPVVEVPRTASAPMPKFRLPSSVTGPTPTVEAPPELAQPEADGAQADEDKKAGKNKKAGKDKKAGKNKKAGKDKKAGSSKQTGEKKALGKQTGKKRALADEPAAGERRPGRRRASTGRFRDRTLNWFKTGDELADEEAIEGDYEPLNARGRGLLIAGIVAGVVVAGAVVFLLAS